MLVQRHKDTCPSYGTGLVGTAERVADALLDYCDVGATTLLMRVEATDQDAIDYGQGVIPLVREGVARREAVGR